MNKINIIPMPKSLKAGEGTVKISAVICADAEFATCAETFKFTAKKLFALDFANGEGGIALKKVTDLDEEEYNLSVTENGVLIEATEPIGAINAISSLYQLLTVENGNVTAPVCEINDKPDSAYRAIMVDSPALRSFDQVLHFVDVCHLSKIRYLHCHFADNGGYTLPSKKFPKLPRENGHFTFEQIVELRKYCTDRCIEIIPEIDVPGHATYLNVTYPELFGCDPIEGEARKDLVCIGKPGVFDNLKEIFAEVMEMFPESRYFHVGGDEAIIEAWNNCKDCVAYMKEHNIPNVKALYTRSIKILTDMVLDMGKIPVVWEGFPREGSEEISRDVIVTAWESLYHLPNELLEEGFTVTNSSWLPLYAVHPNGTHAKLLGDWRWQPKDILCDWDIFTWKNWWDQSYAYEKPIVVEPTDKVIGATYCLWLIDYKYEILALKENLPAMSEKIWNVKSTYSYDEFEQALSKLVDLSDKLAP